MENSRKLTGKSQRKIRKMVYGKFFRKPFSKTRVLLPLKSRLSTQSLLSLFLALDFAVLVTGFRGGLHDEAVEWHGGLRDEASPIWGFATRLRRSGDRNRDPSPLATVTHLELVSLSHPGDRTVADLEIP
uniref:Uncharacterized protein n=1 Tax=Fagus sylvatica TaxID=28930 RepID=A0A2N9FEN8_FAGSY